MTTAALPSKAAVAAAMAILKEAGHEPASPPILQPAELFLDLTGEDIRRRLFLTQGTDGADLCLRPDFTIPVCRQHVERGADRSGAYCYDGLVFRQRVEGLGEIPQIGAENIGRTDIAQADADMLALAIAVIEALGVDAPSIRIGDETLFSAVLSGLGLPSVWQRRLRGLFGEDDKLSAAIARMGGAQGAGSDNRDVRMGFLSAMEGADPKAAHAVVEDLLSIAGISAVGGRSPAEIADRFLEQAALAGGAGAHKDAAEALSRYLSIDVPAPEAAEELQAFSKDTGIDLAAPLAAFSDRLAAIEAKGVRTADLRFSASFGRRLDYYTGFVFEIHQTGTSAGQLVGGGRYDRLLKLLGAEADVPATGFSVWLDRIAPEPASPAGGETA